MRVRTCRTLCFTTMVALTFATMAQMDDSHGDQLASHGLGHPSPSARNLSLDSRWNVYGFERDSISYYQVNDISGQVQIMLGRAGDTFWTLPAGEPHSRISLPSQPLNIPEGAKRSVIYRGADISILHYATGSDEVWVVEVPATSS